MSRAVRQPTGAPLARIASRAACVTIAACALAAVAAGCGSDGGDGGGDKGGPTGPTCVSTRAYFAEQVWAPVMNKVCIKCHSPEGEATLKNAQLLLFPPGYPGFLDANLSSLRFVAKIEYEGKSQLLRKPLGEMQHGGGIQLQEGSPEYEALSELVSRFNTADECPETVSVASFPDVVQLDALGTLRKASLHLLGRLPTPEQVQSILDGGEAALGPAVNAMLYDEAFLSRLKEIYNDMLLTDRYLGYAGYGVNLLNEEDYPNAGAWFDAQTDDEKRKINRAVAREPLELIAHVVKNDRPFTEVLTAQYTVLNPYSAKIYNPNLPFQNPNDENEFVETQVSFQRDGQTLSVPHAGVLSSPMFLNRFPTTPTNRNRHRARMVLQFFLATDILKIAERPIDPTASTKYNNPTRDDPSCNACHSQIDPMAGAFQKFDDNDQERYQPDRDWHQEMFPPGFGKEVMSTSDYQFSLRWLAQRIAEDVRFGLAAVETAFTALTGQKPLPYPVDSAAADYADQLKAWNAQDATFRAVSEKFVAENYDLKTVFRELVLSPYFRAVNASGTLSPARAVQLSNVGTGRLSTPELLSRKIQAVTGSPWVRGYDQASYLTSDYNILYGGIDGENVTERLGVPNGVMANVAWRMANEVACASTAWDLSRNVQQRKLFPHVEADQAPETGGAPSSQNVAAIKKNIQYLHAHVLGENLALTHPEIERTYKLFFETFKEGQKGLADKSISEGIVWSCRARKDPYTGADLPEGERLENDPSYAVRSWMAVLTYLLADQRFLYE